MKFFRTTRRALAARPVLLASSAVGVVAGFLVPSSATPLTRATIGWDCGVLCFLFASAARFATSTTPARMAANAAAQEEGEWTIFALTVAGIAFSFAAIIGEFSAGGSNRKSAFHLALVVVTLVTSWLMTQVTFAYRYAHEYYAKSFGRRDVDGGLDFPGEAKPDYWDFLYFSLVLGMTFQVSDVQITSRKLRRLASIHGVLSFAFNTVIIALGVNLAASLL